MLRVQFRHGRGAVGGGFGRHPCRGTYLTSIPIAASPSSGTSGCCRAGVHHGRSRSRGGRTGDGGGAVLAGGGDREGAAGRAAPAALRLLQPAGFRCGHAEAPPGQVRATRFLPLADAMSAQPSMRAAAILATCSPGRPNNWPAPCARLKRQRCASCSQVMPMAPCIWIICPAVRVRASEQYAFAAAASIPSPAESAAGAPQDRRRRRQTPRRTQRPRRLPPSTCRSAIRCWSAWKLPMGRPNCTRAFV